MLSGEFQDVVNRRNKWMQEKSMSRESKQDYEFCLSYYNRFHKKKLTVENCGACQRRHMGQIIGKWIENCLEKNQIIND